MKKACNQEINIVIQVLSFAVVVADHPSYSPNLAPSDFYLFGHVKGVLRGESFETREQLLSTIEGIPRPLKK
jgi:hypothetical protein